MVYKRKHIYQGLGYKEKVKRRKIVSAKKYLKSFSIESYNSLIKLYESRSRLRKVACTRAKISKYHILEIENTGHDIFYKIMSTNVALKKCDNDIEKKINFDNISSIVSPILEKFKNKHNQFKYCEKLKYIMKKADKKLAKQKYKGQIRICLLKFFFGLVLYNNVPFQLFGTRQNFKAVKKSIYCLLKTHPKKIPIKLSLAINKKKTLKTAIGGLLNIEPLLEKLDISKIEWLHPIKDIKQKWIIMLKLLHWFFAQYIIKILHKYIVLISSKNQWLYIMKDDWCQIQHTFINEKVNRGDLLLYPVPGNEIIHNKIYVNRLTASSSGLRVIAKCNLEKKSFKIEICLRFLQQLYCTYINEKGLPSVKSCIQQIHNFKKTTHDCLYYVRCDIQDAFGSIKQNKLLNIIKNCCRKHLPLYIVMREYQKKGKNVKKQQKIKTTVQFLDMRLLKLHSIGTSIVKKPQLVNWLKLIYIIKTLLLKNTIKLYSKIYLIKTGVPQGLRLSSIFSEIYYQDMFNKFSEFSGNGLLCRYVDDVLYITKEKNYAEQFLKIITDNIPEYGVKFNKIQTNVKLQYYKPTKVRYLGKDIFV